MLGIKFVKSEFTISGTVQQLRIDTLAFDVKNYDLLKDSGKVTAEIAKLHAETEFEKYRVIQDKLFLSDYDRYLLELEARAEGKM